MKSVKGNVTTASVLKFDMNWIEINHKDLNHITQWNFRKLHGIPTFFQDYSNRKFLIAKNEKDD
jgi:hypothetical protein